MKIPPFPHFPLHTYDDTRASEPQYQHTYKPLPRPPFLQHYQQPQRHWLTTIMDSNQHQHQHHQHHSNQDDAHQDHRDHAHRASHKGSLAFILSSPRQESQDAYASAAAPSFSFSASSSGSDTESDRDTKPVQFTTSSSLFPSSMSTTKQAKRRRVTPPFPSTGEYSGSQPASPERKGSKYCIVDGCTSRAKHARKCWRHGGSVKCKVADCINRAKSKGVCWSHGGGTICSHPQCETIAVSHGFCWAHGGGKRCQVGGCSRPAYERTDNFCSTHYKQRTKKAAAAAAAAAAATTQNQS